jgi:hypothetical protein
MIRKHILLFSALVSIFCKRALVAMPERGKAYIGPQIKRQAGASRRPVCQISLIMTMLRVLIEVLQNALMTQRRCDSLNIQTRKQTPWSTHSDTDH